MSKQRTTYHVTKTDDGWKGKKEGAERASIKGDTKEEVVKKKKLSWLRNMKILQ
jgi:hypothetical protein